MVIFTMNGFMRCDWRLNGVWSFIMDSCPLRLIGVGFVDYDDFET